MFPRLRRRGAITLTQGRVVLSARTDHRLQRRLTVRPQNKSSHNRPPHLRANCAGRRSRSAVPCVVSHAANHPLKKPRPNLGLPRGFYGCWRAANPGHRHRACHTSNDGLGLRQPSNSQRSKSHLANSIGRIPVASATKRQLCDYFFCCCLLTCPDSCRANKWGWVGEG